MYEANQAGIATRFTTAGATVLSTVGNINLLGVACTPSVSAKFTIQIWAGTTATGTVALGSAGVAITGIITFLTSNAGGLARTLRVPAYCSGGCVINIAGDANPDLTLFWNPA